MKMGMPHYHLTPRDDEVNDDGVNEYLPNTDNETYVYNESSTNSITSTISTTSTMDSINITDYTTASINYRIERSHQWAEEINSKNMLIQYKNDGNYSKIINAMYNDLPIPLRSFANRYCTNPLHGVLCTIATSLIGLSIILYRLFWGYRTRVIKYIHMLLHLISLVIMCLGIWQANVQEYSSSYTSFSTHTITSWIIFAILILQDDDYPSSSPSRSQDFMLVSDSDDEDRVSIQLFDDDEDDEDVQSTASFDDDDVSINSGIVQNGQELNRGINQHQNLKELPPYNRIVAELIVVEDADYGYFILPPKGSIYAQLQKRIATYVRANVNVRIGAITFKCDLMVLQCYSKFFTKLNGQRLVELPEDKVLPNAFLIAYNWMMDKTPFIRRDKILQLYNAAKFLQIDELSDNCWKSLINEHIIYEFRAYLVYLQSCKCVELEKLKEIMLRRIKKFFLTMVAKDTFVQMTANDLIILLSSNSIGVNSEIEVFLSAVRWLDYDWKGRERYVLDIMKTVRFPLIPLWFLTTLTMNTGQSTIDRILLHNDVNLMIRDGISNNIHQKRSKTANPNDLNTPMPRQWIFDKQCNHHHYFGCPKMEYVTYQSFLDHLNKIKTFGAKHWRTVKYCKQITHCCKTSSNDSQKMDTTLSYMKK